MENKKRKKAKSRLQIAIEQHKRDAKAGSNLSNIRAMLINIEQKIEGLKSQIRVDNREIAELEKQLIPLRKKRDDMNLEMAELNEFIEHFDRNIGPFNGSYDSLQEGLKEKYDIAKAKYAAGIQLLVDVYDYHPMYKRWHDTFSSTPFKPK
mmetsp:Transcript_11599/g.16224  ORF Transcript_11599/g.16224 Transcript_11599/m.16224 type:complete len:151 (-) Transcript_11599:166-618(-)